MKLFSDALMAERKIKDIEKENNVWDAIEYLTQHPQTKFKQRLIDVVLKAPNSAEIIRQNKPVFGFLYDDSILKLTSDVGYVLNYLEQAKPVKDKRPFIDFILSQDATPSVLMDFGIVLGDENGIMPQEIQEALIAKTIVVSNAWELHLENFSEENRQKMALNIMNRAETEKVGNSANILKSLRAYYPDLVDFQQIFEQSKQNGNYINCFDIIMDETLALRPTPGEVVDFYSFYASKIVEVIETYKQNHTDGDYRALAVELYSKLDLDKAIKLGKGKQGNIYSALADNLPIEVLSEIVVSNMDLFTLNDAEVSKVEEYLSQNESVITQYKFFKKYPALCDKQNLLDRLLMEYKELEETIVTKPNLNISEDEVDAINNRRYRKSYEGGNIEGVEYSPCTKDDVMRKKLNEYFSEIDYKERTMKEFRHMIDEISSAIQADKKACQKPASQDGGQDDSREL